MPGQDSYGSGGKWIHDRAHHILDKNPDLGDKGQRGKSIAYAIATQQAHATGKSPKAFRTSSGVREAKQKYDAPKKLYVNTADPKSESTSNRLEKLRKSAEVVESARYLFSVLNKQAAGPPPSIPTPQFPTGVAKIQPRSVNVSTPASNKPTTVSNTYSQVHSQPPAVNSTPYSGVKSAPPPPATR